MRVEINKIDIKKQQTKSSKLKSGFWKDQQIDKGLTKPTKNEREKTQTTKIRNEERHITTNLTEMKRTKGVLRQN